MAYLDVVDLTSVGPVLAQRLNEFGVFTIADLLRAKRHRLADAITGVSLAQVRNWQAVSELLEVNDITLPLAEGLYEAGVETLDELASRSLSQLRTLFETMRAQEVVDALPSDDSLDAWMKDALLLCHTGTQNGTVTNAGGSPVAGATVSCMSQQAETDVRGRFRLRRLPLGRRLLLHLEHSDYAAKTVEIGPVAPAGVLVSQQFRLTRKAAAATLRVRSELQGDRLLTLSGAPIRVRVQDEAPSELDLLRIVELPESGNVRVVSCLFDFDGSAFIVRSYRLGREDLPANLQVGDHLRYKAGRWQVVEMKPAAIERYHRWLRERRRLVEPSANASAAEVERFVRDWLDLHAKD
jgi:Domain of unknown function (DUF4332)